MPTTAELFADIPEVADNSQALGAMFQDVPYVQMPGDSNYGAMGRSASTFLPTAAPELAAPALRALNVSPQEYQDAMDLVRNPLNPAAQSNPPNFESQAMSGIINKLNTTTGNVLTDPLAQIGLMTGSGVGRAALGEVAPAINRVLTGIFAGQAAVNAPEVARNSGTVLGSDAPISEKAAAFLDIPLTATMIGGLGSHTLRGSVKAVRSGVEAIKAKIKSWSEWDQTYPEEAPAQPQTPPSQPPPGPQPGPTPGPTAPPLKTPPVIEPPSTGAAASLFKRGGMRWFKEQGVDFKRADAFTDWVEQNFPTGPTLTDPLKVGLMGEVFGKFSKADFNDPAVQAQIRAEFVDRIAKMQPPPEAPPTPGSPPPPPPPSEPVTPKPTPPEPARFPLPDAVRAKLEVARLADQAPAAPAPLPAPEPVKPVEQPSPVAPKPVETSPNSENAYQLKKDSKGWFIYDPMRPELAKDARRFSDQSAAKKALEFSESERKRDSQNEPLQKTLTQASTPELTKYVQDEGGEILDEGDIWQRVIWRDKSDRSPIKTQGAASLGHEGAPVGGLHVGDPDYWKERLAKDYDRNPKAAKTVNIRTSHGDILVDDKLYSTDPDTGEKRDSHVLLTPRTELVYGKDWVFEGESFSVAPQPAVAPEPTATKPAVPASPSNDFESPKPWFPPATSEKIISVTKKVFGDWKDLSVDDPSFTRGLDELAYKLGFRKTDRRWNDANDFLTRVFTDAGLKERMNAENSQGMWLPTESSPRAILAAIHEIVKPIHETGKSMPLQQGDAGTAQRSQLENRGGKQVGIRAINQQPSPGNVEKRIVDTGGKPITESPAKPVVKESLTTELPAKPTSFKDHREQWDQMKNPPTKEQALATIDANDTKMAKLGRKMLDARSDKKKAEIKQQIEAIAQESDALASQHDLTFKTPPTEAPAAAPVEAPSVKSATEEMAKPKCWYSQPCHRGESRLAGRQERQSRRWAVRQGCRGRTIQNQPRDRSTPINPEMVRHHAARL
jgi:hypothetical protein